MTLIPLSELRLTPRCHLSALWWLALLYRQPSRFTTVLESLKPELRRRVATQLPLHFGVYALLAMIVGRVFLVVLFGLPTSHPMGIVDHLAELGIGVILAIFGGLALGWGFGQLGGIPEGLAFGLAGGATMGLLVGVAKGLTLDFTEGVPFGIVGGVGTGVAFGIALGIARGISRREVTSITGGIAGGIMGGLLVGAGLGLVRGAAFGAAFGMSFWIAIALTLPRAFYLPVHVLFVWPRVLADRYRFHPVVWDDLCTIRFPGLYRLLAEQATADRMAAEAEIERLRGIPSHRIEALKAQAVLVARKAGRAKSLERLQEICSQLPEGQARSLRETPELKRKVAEIASYQELLDSLDRPFLRGLTSQLLLDRIETFRDQISGFSEPLASEFRAASSKWLKIAENQRDQARYVMEREPTAQVFRAGDPVDRDKEAFIPRLPIFEALEAQVMLATGCPGILLYGRRRVGKSTVLKNLPGFLPPSVQVVYVSMQNPQAFTSLAYLTQHLAEAIGNEIAEGQSDELPTDLATFFRYLDRLDDSLRETGTRLLLGLDEYENVDRKIREGVFPEDLLDTLRESIQTHRQITWVFSGSYSIDELDGAEWSSYLVSARTVEVPPFTLAETRLLLTEPLKHSTLWDADDPECPRFSPEMWGERGIERIHEQVGGWPHLVQLVAETLVDRMNDAGKRQVDDLLFERSLDAAVTAGDTVLSQLLRGESQVPGEWEYLLGFRDREVQPPPDDGAVRSSLQRRLLVVPEGEDGWRLRAPLFRRWLAKRGG